MDPYEILGVRPSAGVEEIELAYKGRRSQYHPDRYNRSDSETQAWATAKMQDVNEAYRALTNPELHARTGRHETRRNAEAAETRHTPAPGAARKGTDVASVLLNPEWIWFHDRVFARPNIPLKKLQGAIGSYAPSVSPDDVVVLLDDTMFGGAKEGLLVTNEAMYCKQKFESPRQLELSLVAEVAPGTDSRLLVNGREYFKADFIDHLAMLTFASRLSHVFKQGNPFPGKSEAQKETGASAINIIHSAAMDALGREFEGEILLVDELIDRQMRSVADEYMSLRAVAEDKSRQRKDTYPIGAATTELALILLVVLHFHAFSKLPREFKEDMGDEFSHLHGVSEAYKVAYRAEFVRLFGRQMEMSDEDLLTISAIFFHRDGAGPMDLNIPRDEALSKLFVGFGIPRKVVEHLIRQFEDHVKDWLDSIVGR